MTGDRSSEFVAPLEDPRMTFRDYRHVIYRGIFLGPSFTFGAWLLTNHFGFGPGVFLSLTAGEEERKRNKVESVENIDEAGTK